MEKLLLGQNDERIKNLIREHDAISFDLFDTLLMRLTSEPHDVFEALERRAEQTGVGSTGIKEARIKAETVTLPNIPNIDELYVEMQKILCISEETANRIQGLEVAIEENNILCRESVRNLVIYAKSLGKKVTYISDMYFGKEILSKWLLKLDIPAPDYFFVSCDYHSSKAGNLFQLYKKTVHAKNYLHIGDNTIYDGSCAERFGIESYIIPSAITLLEKTKLIDCKRYMDSYENRTIIGLFAAKMFRDPFLKISEDGRLIVETLEELVYISVAPIISTFVKWLSKSREYYGISELLLPSRDGYIINELLKLDSECAYKHPYIFFSRIAGRAATVENEKNFNELMRRPENLSFKDTLSERINIETEDDEKEFYSENSNRILTESKEVLRRYKEYISPHLCGDRIGFFDFVSAGTCLSLFNKISEINCIGLFFYNYDKSFVEQNQLEVDSFLNDEEGTRFWKHYKFFETVVTSDTPAFIRFGMDNSPVYEKELRSKTELLQLKKSQEAILKYYYRFCSLTLNDMVDKDLLLEFVGLLDERKIVLTDVEKNNIILYDSVGVGVERIFKGVAPKKIKTKKFAIFGAGKIGERYLELFSEWGIEPEFICDNDETKYGKSIRDIPIVSPMKLIDKKINNIIITCKNSQDIEDQLKKMGISEMEVYVNPDGMELLRFIVKNSCISSMTSSDRILFDFSGGYVLGGVESWSVSFANKIRALGKNVRFVIPENKADSLNYNDERIDVFGTEFGMMENYFISSLPCVAIVNFPYLFSEGVFRLKECVPNGIRVVAIIHNDEDAYYDLYLKNQNNIDLLLYISNRMQNRLVNMGFPAEKMRRLKWKIPCKEELNRRYSNNGMPLAIGYGGRVTVTQKRADQLIVLIDKLISKKVDFVLNIAGDGDYLDEMKYIINKRGLDDYVVFHGMIERDKMDTFWEHMDIAVNVSEWEGKSISQAEAMAAGAVPIVTNTSGAGDDIVDGQNGYIVQLGNIEGMSEIIKDLYENREKLKLLGEKAYQTIVTNNDFDEMEVWSQIID